MDTREKGIESSLQRLVKVGLIAKRVFLVSLFLFSTAWIIAMICEIVQLIFPGVLQIEILDNPIVLVPLLAHGLLIIILLFLGFTILRDISKGLSPFGNKQVNRIRNASIVFGAYALFDLLWSPDLIRQFSLGLTNFGFWADSATPLVLHLNGGMVVSAVLFYCLSLAFRHGSLLQRLSDEIA